jgi:outer membrane protein OmpA-like peptidoglycan-associated protein
MNVSSRVSVLLTMLLVSGLVSACALRSGSGQRPGRAVVVLLPDPEDSHVGRIVVLNPQGSKELTSARASTRVTLTQAPRIRTLSESDVNRLFGEILRTLPPPPRHFTLPFRFDSEELTEEGKRLVPDVLQAVKSYPVPEVVVIGHTDTTGTPQANAELGMRRANAVRTLLAQAGLNESAIDVRSHGEAELLVPTADSVFEPKNRRVEITVR